MPLTLVLGPANSAKAGEVLGAYSAAASARDAMLVVPTSGDAAHYDHELAAGGAVLGRALTFPALIDEVARRAGFTGRRLTPLQRERLLRRTIAGLELPALTDSARAAGFPAAAGRLLAELAGERVGAPRFAAALRSWAAQAPGREAYAGDLATVALAYENALERTGRLDGERYAWGALDALRAAAHRWRDTPVFFYGFDDLTTVERDAVETLAGRCGAAITVSLTHEPGRVALAARARVVEELRGQADVVRELPPLDEHYASDAGPGLHHLERRLFEAGIAQIDPEDAVVLMEAGGERAEAELVAAEVHAGLRAGVPPEEIVVVCRSLARSGALLERALNRLGIPVTSPRTVPLGHTALGRGLLALGRCAFGNAAATAGDLLAYLRTPGVCADPAEVDELEARIARRGVSGLAEALGLLGRPMPELEALAAADDPAAALGGAARGLLAAPLSGRAARLAEAEMLDARACSAVLRALAELAELPAGEAMTGDEVLALLEGLTVPVGPAGPAAGAVLLAEPLAIRARRFRRVIVTGLCEGEFPARGGGEPFFGPERRRELALASGLALTADEDDLARERYLLYACVSRAAERLVLTYRSSDEDGNLVLPSPFLADVAELFVPEWRERRVRRLLADVVWDASDAPTAREQRLALAAAEAEAEAEPGSAAAQMTRRLGEAALGHVRHREILSGGALESFAACPVKWLVESQLQPGELRPEAEPLVRGSFMHDVLERVVSGLGGPVTAASLPRAQELLAGCVARVPDGLAPGRPEAVRVAILRGIEADLHRYLRHEAGDGCEWRPVALERRFGFDDEDDDEEGSLPALVLGEGDEAVRVRGVIDRIDAAPAGASGQSSAAIVRDYKSGSVRNERCGAKWVGEQQFQVALYMLAVRRLLGLEPVAGFYQPLTGASLRARGAYLSGAEVGRGAYGTDAFDREALDALLEEIEAQAVEVAARLRCGELTPTPETCGRDGCRHPGICWAA